MATSLLFNPNASLTLKRDQGMIQEVKVLAPVRGEGLRLTLVKRADDPELFNALMGRQIADAKGWPHTFPESLDLRLVEIGLLVREDQIARRVGFCCDLTSDLLEFLPRRARALFSSVPDTNLIVNPSLLFLGDSDSPVDPDLRSCAKHLGGERFWYLVSDPEQYGPRLYSCNSDQHEYLGMLQDGQPAFPLPNPDWLALLVGSEILIPHADFQLKCQEASQKLASANSHLSPHRYAVLRSIIHPFQLAAIRRYYRELVEEGYLRCGDDEWPLRFFIDNDPIGRFFHRKLTPLICKITREEVSSTFLYIASYRPGAVLPPHRDRHECDYSISLLLDFIPEPEDLSSWPIYVEQPNQPQEPIPVYLGIGDMLLYRGRELLHYREAFQEGEVSTTWLFFYQPVSGLSKMDSRDVPG